MLNQIFHHFIASLGWITYMSELQIIESASSGLKYNSNKHYCIFSMVSPILPSLLEIMVYHHPISKTWITTLKASVSLGDETLLLMICLRKLLWTMMAWHREPPWDMGNGSNKRQQRLSLFKSMVVLLGQTGHLEHTEKHMGRKMESRNHFACLPTACINDTCSTVHQLSELHNLQAYCILTSWYLVVSSKKTYMQIYIYI